MTDDNERLTHDHEDGQDEGADVDDLARGGVAGGGVL